MPYRETYGVVTESGVVRTVTIVFASELVSQLSEVDLYDDCREKIQLWLDKHYSGEQIASEGDDIERSGSPADNDDVIDMTAVA